MLRRFLYFSKSDRRAISALIATAMIAIAVAIFVDNAKKDENEVSADENVKTDNKNNYKTANSSTTAGNKTAIDANGEDISTSLPIFDPNTVDSTTLALFGIKNWKIRNLIKYRQAGGIFREPEAISRLYGWTEEEVKRIIPYIRISDKYRTSHKRKGDEYGNRKGDEYGNRKGETSDEYVDFHTNRDKRHNELSKIYKSSKFQKDTIIDVNTADTAILRRIPGIGKGISKAIVDYRQKLGGYYSTKQLLEIKIFSPELLKWFSTDISKITRINSNKASFQSLNSHPYISYEQTKSILNYRRLYGEFKDLEKLQASGIFTEKEIERLAYYLEF